MSMDEEKTESKSVSVKYEMENNQVFQEYFIWIFSYFIYIYIEREREREREKERKREWRL